MKGINPIRALKKIGNSKIKLTNSIKYLFLLISDIKQMPNDSAIG
jgi:hypothetical protein